MTNTFSPFGERGLLEVGKAGFRLRPGRGRLGAVHVRAEEGGSGEQEKRQQADEVDHVKRRRMCDAKCEM